MRSQPTPLAEMGRVRSGPMASDGTMKNTGMFNFLGPARAPLVAVASDGLGWEHVSVSVPGTPRCPTWGEMCFIKAQFWHPEETVVQYHPAKEDYVDCHPYTLHMWKPTEERLPIPPWLLVGPKA